jgi:beta-lactamase superfamily II metal-dependent hydrolase
MRFTFALALLVSSSAALHAARTLDFYFIDTEGGQATLILTPDRESILVDTGFRGFEGRDANRIVAAAKAAGVKKIDYLVITHHHLDHVGGVSQLVERMPVVNFVDKGRTVESSPQAADLYKAYEEAVAKGKRMIVKPGDKLPVKGLEVTVLSAAGDFIAQAVPGGGQPNALCGSEERKAEDKSDNAQSVGFLLTYGKFRFVDLGDLTWNKEMDLVCPYNRAGAVDVYLTTHHGMNSSGPATIVHALKPRVAIMNNGAKKGGSPDAYQVIRKSPGLEDIWQLHFALAGGKENNSPDSFIANTDPACEGRWLKMSVEKSGAYTITNSRNGYTKSYAAGR